MNISTDDFIVIRVANSKMQLFKPLNCSTLFSLDFFLVFSHTFRRRLDAKKILKKKNRKKNGNFISFLYFFEMLILLYLNIPLCRENIL